MTKDTIVKKPKEFFVNDYEYSEYAFIVSNLRTFEEIRAYWDVRRMEVEKAILKRCGLNREEYVVSFDTFFSSRKIFAAKKPPVKVNPEKGENAKFELPKEQKQGIPSSEPVKKG